MRSFALAITTLLGAFTSSAYANGSIDLEYIGEATFHTGYEFKGVEVGGLSGIDYDENSNSFVAVGSYCQCTS
jgi:hypothetical protein